jgi:hypothetical protein
MPLSPRGHFHHPNMVGIRNSCDIMQGLHIICKKPYIVMFVFKHYTQTLASAYRIKLMDVPRE